MKKTAMKPSAFLAPVPPVMVSCSDGEHDNIITIAWTGILNTQPPKTYISVRPTRYSYDIIKNSGEFVINLATENMVRPVDWCGVKSGRDVDKFAEMRLGKQASNVVSCPQIEQSPISLECKVSDIIPLGTHDMFIADIVSVNVAEDLFGETGKIRVEKAKLLSYAHGEYFALGRRLGSFGCSVKKRKRPDTKKKKK